MVDILNHFPSIHMSAEFLLTQLPLLQPRFYSVSSSRKVTPDEVHLTMDLASYQIHGEFKIQVEIIQFINDQLQMASAPKDWVSAAVSSTDCPMSRSLASWGVRPLSDYLKIRNCQSLWSVRAVVSHLSEAFGLKDKSTFRMAKRAERCSCSSGVVIPSKTTYTNKISLFWPEKELFTNCLSPFHAKRIRKK